MTTFFIETDNALMAEQSAGSNMDYGVDWSDWLDQSLGDAIVLSDWSADDPALVLTNKSFEAPFASVWVQGGAPGKWYTLVNNITTRDGRRDSRVCLLYVKPGAAGGSALFPSRAVALAKLRRDRLVLLANSIMPDLQLSDDFLWDKILAAEAAIAHELRVPLRPTTFFPRQPTLAQLAALPVGMPWAVDPAYDYDAANFYGDKWGMIVTRQKPIQSITGMRFVYPTPAQTILEVPPDWIRGDFKYGQIQLVPTGTAYQTLLGGLFMSQLSGGRQLPFTIDLEYVAGIANAAAEYPELVDAVMRSAVIKIVEDGFLPQSGSISADGLSQSTSVDTSKYYDSIDRIINGPNGNGGLMARIHGIRAMVI